MVVKNMSLSDNTGLILYNEQRQWRDHIGDTRQSWTAKIRTCPYCGEVVNIEYTSYLSSKNAIWNAACYMKIHLISKCRGVKPSNKGTMLTTLSIGEDIPLKKTHKRTFNKILI